MVSIGYEPASEEHGPNDLVWFAAIAEDSGFVFALMMPRRFFLGVGTGEDLKSAPIRRNS
jgi:hypothetical protein